jgi:protein-disulfide isomerase
MDNNDNNTNNQKEDNVNNSENTKNITLKRSTFIKLAIVGILALMVSSFLAGFTLQIGITPTYVTLPSSPTVAPTTLPSNTPPSPSPSIAGANNPPTQQQPTVLSSVSLDNDPIEGSKDAPVTLVEFSDYQCPFCKRTFDDTMPELKEKYIDTGKIKHVFRDYPLPFHQNGIPAAIAAECANEQGKFWDYHNILFSKQTEWENLSGNATNEKFKEYAANNMTQLDKNKFNSCIDSQKYKDEVEKDIADGSTYGVSGTPTFYIGNKEKGYTQIVGAQPLATFESIINKLSTP